MISNQQYPQESTRPYPFAAPGSDGWQAPRHRHSRLPDAWQTPTRPPAGQPQATATRPADARPAAAAGRRSSAPAPAPLIREPAQPQATLQAGGHGPPSGAFPGTDRSGPAPAAPAIPPTAEPELRWPHPAVAAEPDVPYRWSPLPRVTELITPEFRGWLTSRLATATAAHADHALRHRGDTSSEPGPHALLLISAVPPPPINVPERPPWWRPTDEHPQEPSTATVRVASRLVGLGDGDDIIDMLDRLTHVAAEQMAAAYTDGALYAFLDDKKRENLADRLDQVLPWEPPAPFPYAAALAHGLLWDPRAPLSGLAPTSQDPLTVDTCYLGVAVTTLDTPITRWADAKDSWRRARDPDTGLPVTAFAVPGTAFAVLEDGTAIHTDRIPQTGRQPRTHTAVSNAVIKRDPGRLTDFDHQPWFIEQAPPAPRPHYPPTPPTSTPRRRLRAPRALLRRASAQSAAGQGPPAQHSRELWDRLATLHMLLRRGFGYEPPS